MCEGALAMVDSTLPDDCSALGVFIVQNNDTAAAAAAADAADV